MFSRTSHVMPVQVGGPGETAVPAARPAPRPRLSGPLARSVKHGFDRTVALTLLLAFAPLLLSIALAVRVTSTGPALFRHQRIGRDGRPFSMWKFRTMALGADEQLAGLLGSLDRDREPLFKVPADPRVTPLGRMLRRWSLDELPQLVNVARGQMSLVGPRPQVAAEVALYNEREVRRLAVRPGITGLWQVSGRSQLPWQQAIELDLHYVEHWSLPLDATVLMRTIGAVLSGRGAC